MNLADILSYRNRLSVASTRFIVGFLLTVGFCLQNAKLIPALPGEYQPIIFTAGCCIAILAWQVPQKALYAALALFFGTVLSVAMHYILVAPLLPKLSDILRLAIGPIMLAGIATAWQQIDLRWLWGILIGGILFALIGSIDPSWTTFTVSKLGIRINDAGNAYPSWAAFFFSEYSYAALAFAAVFAWLNARTKSYSLESWVIIALATTLIVLTHSGTGFAMIGMILLSQLRPRYWILAGALLCSAFFVSTRIERLAIALWHLVQGDLELFFLVDGSTAWRFLSNILALKVEAQNLTGTIGLNLVPYAKLLQTDSPNIQNLINEFLGTQPTVAAQGIFFNYGLFGGLVLQGILLAVIILGVIDSSTLPRNPRNLLVLLLLYTFFVQSGLTSPAPWICLGILLSPPRQC